MELKNKIVLFFAVLILVITVNCGLSDRSHKKVRILRVTAKMPQGFCIEVRNTFKSVPWLCFCGGISMRDGSFIPDKEYKWDYLEKSGQTIEVPLTWPEKSLCEWTYYSTDIILTDTSKSGQLFVSVIYHDRGDLPLGDTIDIVSKRCVNPCLDPPHYYPRCKDKYDLAYGRDIFYSLAENNKDTVDLFVNMYYTSDTVSICDEGFRECLKR